MDLWSFNSQLDSLGWRSHQRLRYTNRAQLATLQTSNLALHCAVREEKFDTDHDAEARTAS